MPQCVIGRERAWMSSVWATLQSADRFTAVGAMPILFGRLVSQRSNGVLLGFAAAIMLAASFLTLIVRESLRHAPSIAGHASLRRSPSLSRGGASTGRS
jgi:zinc transporter ZupT